MMMATATLALFVAAMQGFAQIAAVPKAPPARAAESEPAHVERVQKALKTIGHDPGPIDGIIGTRTVAALKAYQKEHGLSETGRLDDATLAKLGERVQASQIGGDTKPSAVDPAQAHKTGANVGEGASYSRSTDQGQSTLGDSDRKH
jgi:peptidoglycan hydrolase-like protein with peptidoglycan-binding domain